MNTMNTMSFEECYKKKKQYYSAGEIIEEYTKNKDVKITEKLSAEVTNKDEISTIIAKFSDMIYQLELYIQNLTKTKQDLKNQREQAIELNELSLKDPLTGIRNKEGYYKEVQKIEWEMTDDDTELGIAVIDIDSLQSINSAYGTDKGDVTLIAVSQILCKVFEHSPVFRLEDGKFAVILRDHDLEHIDDLIIEFHHILNERKTYPHLEKWEKPSATIGFATYNHEIDISFDNVLVRAEKDMKNNKKTNRS